ncbi:magnesium-translocating P-type ATPase [Leptospira hartskeerlii]|uniref:Magnesium-transporting ATPase, P-type 1 n=1 Tax=Leptospira hartskeerlii TaxID=2023177 RepID=A0A2M9X9Q2_9LEPT|nr:magnesium-translocating P-type ATPase [Leptospira hartskeerlii]PJZ24423.1 magnesium-translocating P-type ATPase [Leptospira hartskeerlii]PJZ32965.1 magnesium-translocating P-type ATPase [Leptospira hartskeerlii]
MESRKIPPNYWTYTSEEMFSEIGSGPRGLSESEARERLRTYGKNSFSSGQKVAGIVLFLRQFANPITIILLFASGLSWFLSDPTDGIIIQCIVFLSSILGYWQEKSASDSLHSLLSMVRLNASTIRNNVESELDSQSLVPGDLIRLRVGDIIPADAYLIDSDRLFLDEAAFTGETFPVEKIPGSLPEETTLSKRSNLLYMGSHVVSGSGLALIYATGKHTQFGEIYKRLNERKPETEFEKGIRKFGNLLLEITLGLVLVILGINVLLEKPILDSFLFALAIAVGLTPQLLPAIINVNLAQGAKQMSRKKVIVKRLNSIENFGSMDVLCSDKTGTLTEGVVRVHTSVDPNGNPNQDVLKFASINANLQSGFQNPMDLAISQACSISSDTIPKSGELSYDFHRKRITVIAEIDGKRTAICKGASVPLLEICDRYIDSQGQILPISKELESIQTVYETFSRNGYRTIGIAVKEINENDPVDYEIESSMIFLGFVAFSDSAKVGIQNTIQNLRDLGIRLKMITGDNRWIAEQVAKSVGISCSSILTGQELQSIGEEALRVRAEQTDVFAEIEPNQKQRIILALKKADHVVGYIGDGINDASALHSADVGISVDSAVDVAKEAADIVLLEKNLAVLLDGVKEGRVTFANTLKYVFMATSANFGNMFSVAGASAFLSYLPLLPKQILLTNLLTDLPEMTIASDEVDQNWIIRPRKWDIKFIGRFMLVFGFLSSLFDYATFGLLLFGLGANETQFQTGWFIESVVSASLIVLVIRTKKVFYRSRPGKLLLGATILCVGFVFAIPYLPFAETFGFGRLPLLFYGYLLGIILLYVGSAEFAKFLFYKKEN